MSAHETPDFRTRVISPASFENSKAPPLPGSERILCRERNPRRFVQSEVVLITGLWLANQLTECRSAGRAVIEFLPEGFTLEETPNMQGLTPVPQSRFGIASASQNSSRDSLPLPRLSRRICQNNFTQAILVFGVGVGDIGFGLLEFRLAELDDRAKAQIVT